MLLGRERDAAPLFEGIHSIMRPSPVLVVIGVAALALGILLACGTEPTGLDSDKGLKLSVALSATQLEVGEPLTITVTLTNTTLRHKVLTVGDCALLFQVNDASGARVIPPGSGWICTLSVRRRVLAPHASESASFVWQTQSHAAGAYVVSGSYRADGISLRTPDAAVQLN